MAFRAAFDRAQFAAIPPIKQPTAISLPESFTYTPQFEDN
jgi:hypothetical protein